MRLFSGFPAVSRMNEATGLEAACHAACRRRLACQPNASMQACASGKAAFKASFSPQLEIGEIEAGRNGTADKGKGRFRAGFRAEPDARRDGILDMVIRCDIAAQNDFAGKTIGRNHGQPERASAIEMPYFAGTDTVQPGNPAFFQQEKDGAGIVPVVFKGCGKRSGQDRSLAAIRFPVVSAFWMRYENEPFDRGF